MDVTLKWEDDVVEVRRLALETELTIGNDDEDLFVPLPAGERSWALLSRPHPGARWTLCAAPGMDARVLFDDGAVSLSELAPLEPDGARRLVLDAPVRAEISIGAFSLELKPDAAYAAALVPFSVDRPLAHTAMPTSALMTALVAAFWLTPEPLHAEEPSLEARRVLTTRIVTRTPPPAPTTTGERTDEPTAAAPARSTRARERESASAAGAAAAAADEVMGALAGLGGGGGDGGALAAALDGVLATGAETGNGLTLRGGLVAETGRGTHHLGGVVRVAGGVPDGTGGSLGVHRERDVARPAVSAGEPVGCDAACRNLIREVVAQHRDAIRHCYERALQARPGLGGRVAVRWTMEDGRVRGTSVAADPTRSGVGSCIARKVRTWRFPELEGVHVVTYPWVFRPR